LDRKSALENKLIGAFAHSLGIVRQKY